MTYIYFGGMTYIDTLDIFGYFTYESYIQSINIGHTSKVNINMGYIYLINIWYTYKFIDFIMV